MSSPDGRERLLQALLRELARGELDSRYVVPVLGSLASPPELGRRYGLGDLYDDLRSREGPSFRALADHVHLLRLQAAEEWNDARARGESPPVPASISELDPSALGNSLEFSSYAESISQIESALADVRDDTYRIRTLGLRVRALDWPISSSELEAKARAAAERNAEFSGVDALRSLSTNVPTLSSNANEADRDLGDWLAIAVNEDAPLSERRVAASRICFWTTSDACRGILELLRQPNLCAHVEIALTLRLGAIDEELRSTRDAWRQHISSMAVAETYARDSLGRMLEEQPLELFLLHRAGDESASLYDLEELRRSLTGASSDALAERMPADERSRLTPVESVASLGSDEAVEAIPSAKSESARPQPKREPRPEPVAARSPSFWDDHVRPFFIENWYMVAGIAMVVAGSSVLAYYTWDKHWLVRYTAMPAILACFTAILGRSGTWIEKRDRENFRGTATLLRGAAITLLPVNFMAVALLSNDPEVGAKWIAVPAMAAVYLGLGAWVLTRWCGAVHESLRLRLGLPLLALNSLVTIGPAARQLSDLSGQGLHFLIGSGFYFGFFLLAGALNSFVRQGTTATLDRHVSWFLGSSLVVTFLQVFAWVHADIGSLPRVTTYAPMVALCGGVILEIERRALALRESSEQDAASFLGFGAFFLAILMSFPDPVVRTITLAIAGFSWTYYARTRNEGLHAIGGITLLALALVAAGFVPGFDRDLRPCLGLVIAVSALGATRFLGAPS
ncbi:MAG: hypothetical protein AAF517_21880, partial [Planctomycetota bacterium]